MLPFIPRSLLSMCLFVQRRRIWTHSELAHMLRQMRACSIQPHPACDPQTSATLLRPVSGEFQCCLLWIQLVSGKGRKEGREEVDAHLVPIVILK